MSALLICELYRGFGAGRRHVVTIFDEATRLRDRLDFKELSSVSRRAGVSMVLATQFAEQSDDENQRNAILGNCSTSVQLSTVCGPSAVYFASRLCQRQSTMPGRQDQVPSFGQRGGRQWTQAIDTVPVLGQREIQDQPLGAVVRVGPLPPGPAAAGPRRPRDGALSYQAHAASG